MVKKWLAGYTNGRMAAQDEKMIILMKVSELAVME
jgi:hypothetical protein